MGHTLSAKKRERQNETRRQHNRANKRVLKKELKEFDATVQEDASKGEEAFKKVQKAVDIAARKGAIPKARANRKKARLAKKLAKAQADK